MIESLTRNERRLANLMSEISERCYSAGWMINTEYVLWDAVTTGPRRFGLDEITQEEIEELIDLSTNAKAWIVFDNEQEKMAVPLEEWKKLFAEGILKDPTKLIG